MSQFLMNYMYTRIVMSIKSHGMQDQNKIYYYISNVIKSGTDEDTIR